MKTLYFALCYSRLMYCVSVWGCTWPSFLKRLFTVQKRILKLIFFKKSRYSSDEIFTNQKMLKLENVHKYFVYLTIYRSMKNNDATFLIQGHSLTTRRNNVNLVVPPFRTTLFKNSILHLGPKLWNCLPVCIKSKYTNMSLDTFKAKIKHHLYDLQANA